MHLKGYTESFKKIRYLDRKTHQETRDEALSTIKQLGYFLQEVIWSTAIKEAFSTPFHIFTGIAS